MYGINCHSPPEILHQWYLGIVTYVVEYFLKHVSTQVKHSLNRIVSRLATYVSTQSDRIMPNISNFKTGFENKSKLTGSERFQLLFIIWLSMLSKHHETELIYLEQCSSFRYVEFDHNIDNNKMLGSKRQHMCRQQLDKILDTMTKYKRWINIFEKVLSICEWLSYSFVGVKKSQFIKKVQMDLHVVDGFDDWQHDCILNQNLK